MVDTNPDVHVTDPQAEQTPATPQAAEPEIPLDDPDYAELASARDALEKELKGETDSAGTQPAQPQDGQADPAAAEQAQPEPQGQAKPEGQPGEAQDQQGQQGQQTVMIPKARLDEALSQREQALIQAAYWRGIAEARAQQAGTQPAEQPQLTPEEQIGALRAEKLALAERYDRGELNTVEYEAQRDRIEDAIDTIKLAQLRPAEPARAQPTTPVTDLRLEELTARLEEEHPYTRLITSEHDWDFLRVKAVERLAAEGVTLPSGTLPPREQYVLRKKMAELTDEFGPLLTGKTIEKPQQKPGGAQPATPPSSLSPTAQARLNKLNMAAEAPPNVNTLGHAQGSNLEVSEARIETMSDEEIAALPQSVRDRMLGRTP